MTKNPKIYLIDKNKRLIKNIIDTEKIIQKIINTSFKKPGISQNFKSKNLKRITKGEFTFYLYLYNSKDIVSDWEEFLPKSLTKGEDFVQQKLSLILFVEQNITFFAL